MITASFALASTPADGDGSASRTTQHAARTTQLRLVEADEWGLTVELKLDSFRTVEVERDGNRYQQVMADGLFSLARPGCPDLPGRGVLLGIPRHGQVTLEVLSDDTTDLTGYRLAPVPAYELRQGEGETRGQGEELHGSLSPRLPVSLSQRFLPEAACTADGFYPPQPAALEVLGFLRGQRVARLTLQPFQYNPVRGTLRLHRRLRVRVRFLRPLTASQKPVFSEKTGFWTGLLSQVLINHASLPQPETSARSPLPASPLSSPVTSTLKIFVEADGFYRIGYDDLRRAGFDPTGLDPRTLRLTCQGVEQPIHIRGEDDGRFDPDDAILFYGQALTSTYTARNVYWLTAAGAGGLRMAERDGSPAAGLPTPTAFFNTLYAEENHTYWQNPPGGQAWDHWYWHQLVAPAIFTVTFTLSHTAPITAEARLQVALRGKTTADVNPDHHTRLWLNGTLLDEAWWDGQIAYQPILTFSQSLLYDGPNTLTIESVGDTGAAVDRLYLNWLRLDYWDTYTAEGDRLAFRSPLSGAVRFELTGFTRPDVEVFDVTAPAAPVRILNPAIQPDGTGYRVTFADAATAESRYLALTREQQRRPVGLLLDTPSDLRSPANGADYIIITHGDFTTATLPLAAHYQDQGLRVAVVDVADIYDEFNAGIFDPAAIRDFLAYAYHHWAAPPPAYVLLVGDANLDFRDNYGTGPPNYVPAHVFDTAGLGETPGDNWFVAVDGDDILPDMFIGRFPARTADEVTQLVEKTLAYATTPPPGLWRSRALFVADDDRQAFTSLNETLMDLLPSGSMSWQIDARDYPPGDPTDDLIGRVNDGVLLLHYTGHSAVDHWGSWAGGYIFSNGDVASLTNGSRLPFATSADCISGFFALPGIAQSLAELLLARKGGGAVAVWSPAGLGYTAGHRVLFSALYRALFGEEPLSLGAATTAAKVSAYGQSEVWGELVETYVLFGDPALRLGYLPAFQVCLPLVVRGAAP